MQLDSEIMLGSIYDATPEAKVKATAVILAHEPTALDILEILGLDSYPQALSTGSNICG